MKKLSKKSIVFLIVAVVAIVFAVVMIILHFSARETKEESGNDRKEVIHSRSAERDIAEIEKNLAVSIHRYDQDVFALDPKNPAEGMKALGEKYPEFLVDRNAWREPMYLKQISGYLQDPYIKEIKTAVDQTFGDMCWLQDELRHALAYYSYYFPNARIPEFYTLVEGIDASPTSPKFCFAIGDSIVILPDWYLGKNYKYYSDYRVDKYIRERCEKRYAAIDCFREIIAKQNLPQKTPITLLDRMIEEGKVIYFTESMFPDSEVADIIGYSAAQFDWAKKNQANVWNYMIENEMIFSKNEDVARRMIGISPETKPFKGSPGRMGAFIGWMIVIRYMENNPSISLEMLMKEPDARKILDASGYKPLK